MKNIQKKILKNTADQIKKIAFAAAGTTSFWGAYQPREPLILHNRSSLMIRRKK